MITRLFKASAHVEDVGSLPWDDGVAIVKSYLVQTRFDRRIVGIFGLFARGGGTYLSDIDVVLWHEATERPMKR
jgi:hypothetical protein